MKTYQEYLNNWQNGQDVVTEEDAKTLTVGQLETIKENAFAAGYNAGLMRAMGVVDNVKVA